MVIKSTFYDTAPGEGVKETSWAESAQSRGPLYGVADAGGLRLTAHPATPYAVNIGPGRFWGHGVWDENTETVIVQCLAPAKDAIRWDLIAGHRDWQPTGGGPTSLTAIPGSSAKALPTARENRPGIVDDQPIWLVKWRGGRTQPEEIIDLRCFASNGGVEIVNRLALDYLETPGAAVKLGRESLRFEDQGNGVWGWGNGETGWVDLTLGTTPGVPNVRHMGWWTKVPGGQGCSARLVAGGTMVQIRGELSYVNTGTPSYEPGEHAVAAILPANMRPSTQGFIVGTSNQYRRTNVYTVNSDGTIKLGPYFEGKVAHFNGVTPL